MPVKEADPRAAELDAAFREAMDAPAKPKEAAAPPPVDHEAPHGRDENGEPLAPFGLTKDGRPRRSAAGRPSKDDQARTDKVAPDDKKDDGGKAKPEPHNYVPALSETSDMAWLFLSLGAKIGPEIPIIGRFIPGDKVGAQAAIFRMHQDGLVGAVQYAAQHSAAAARWAAKLEKGEITWVMMFGMMTLPFIVQSATVWKLPAEAKLGGEQGPTAADLAGKNSSDLDDFMSSLARKFAEATMTAESAAAAATVIGRDLNGQHPDQG